MTDRAKYAASVLVVVALASCGRSPAEAPPPTVPDAPVAVAAVAGDGQARVSWRAPLQQGGSPVTGYVVSAAPGGTLWNASGLELLATGLTNGTAYTFTVKARNAVGEGAASLASEPVVPAGAPGVPTSVTAVGGAGSATVGWLAPSQNGGAPITGYTVTSNPGGLRATTTATEVTVSGLTRGTVYTFTVTATNAVGLSGPSAPSNPVMTTNVPAAPASIVAMPGDAQATVSWTVPADDGGSAITGYVVANAAGDTVANSTGATQVVVTGLTNGVTYAFTVRAINALGAGAPSGFSNSVTPMTVPGAPTGVVATRGNARAVVSWTAPVSNGGSAVLSYTVTSSPGGLSAFTTGATQATVLSLVNGTPYTFTVTATSAVGAGAPSGPSNPVTPATVPGAPGLLLAVRGNASATVSWAAPVDDGGAAVTGYVITASPGGLTAATAGATQVTVTGLTNGTSYTFTARAANDVGAGLVSAPSNAVTPITVAGPPTAVTAVGGNSQATVTWFAPADDGASPIFGYTVTASPGGVTATTSGATQATLSGLANGTSYTFTVRASNAAGVGPPSAASNAVTPATIPGAPTGVVALPASGSAIVQWSPPADDGGAAISLYTVISNPGGFSATTTGATQVTVPGLTNGSAYRFTVTAANSAGTGPASLQSNPVTPASVPSAPQGVTAAGGNAVATVSWSAPTSDGGAAITGYRVIASPGSATAVTTGATQATVTGLSNGTSYTFTVEAMNAAGAGPPSAPSNPVTPATTPGPPTAVVASGANGTFTVSWAAPLDDGGAAVTRYLVRSTPVGAVATTTATQVTLTGFRWAPSFKFTVIAVNARGSSGPSLPSNAVPSGGALCSGALVLGRTLPQIPTGTSVTSSVSGDFDGDGKPDLAFVHSGQNLVGIQRGLGNGTFSRSASLPIPSGTIGRTLITGDFDADGRSDLVLASGIIGVISVFRGKPDGTFQLPIDTLLGANPVALATADFDGDGKLDLAVRNTASLSILRGNGNGTFQVPTSYPDVASSVATGDFNADGKRDLALVTGAGMTLRVRLGNGDGTLQAGLDTPLTSTATAVAAGHLNADANLDLVVISPAGATLFPGDGTGALGAPTVLANLANPSSVTLGDFDGNGTIDLALTDLSSLAISLQAVGGSFQAPVTQVIGSGLRSPVARDFDGDGKLDLGIVVSSRNAIVVLPGQGDGSFLTPTAPMSSGGPPMAITSADFNADGRLDLAVALYSSGKFGVALGRGDGTFDSMTTRLTGSETFAVKSADLNGDGKADVVVANRGSANIQVFLGDGTGAFQSPTTIAVGVGPSWVTPSDFNLDGVIDLAVANYNSAYLTVLLGTPTGVFQPSIDVQLGAQGGHSIATADFNGDGRPDMAVSNFNLHYVSVLSGNGNGTFGAPSNYPTGQNARSVTAADFNGDGLEDLAVANYGSASISVLRGNSDGSFQAHIPYPMSPFGVPSRPVAIECADLDADGKVDLLVADYDGNTMKLLRGAGDGTFGEALHYPVGANPYGVVAGDFNADGAPDVAVGNFASNTISVAPRTACLP